jgi:hypothetical protein
MSPAYSRASVSADGNSGITKRKGGIMKRIVSIAIGSLLSIGCITADMAAQSQTQSSGQSSTSATSSGTSLGDYARQIRKTPASGAAKVFDNDNLPKDDKLSIVGPAPAAQSDDASEAKKDDSSSASSATGENKGSTESKTGADSKPADQTAKNPPQDQAEKEAAAKQWEDKISAQKDAIDLLARELDVEQREYQLRAAAFYADAGNRLRNQSAWDQEDAKYKEQIADKQKALDDAKQKMDDIQEGARKAGVASSATQP